MTRCLIILVLLTIRLPGFTQEEKEFTVKGVLVDSLDSKGLGAATISVVGMQTNRLLKYGLSSSTGKFEFAFVIQGDTSVAVRVVHLGYQELVTEESIPGSSQIIDVDTLIMYEKYNLIEEVTLSRPPILVNRDTLEIYPAAFELRENAVVEDLLKAVPGITVWGDGQITVNGRNVSTVLVDGKPFFGGETTVATRNLPTEIIEKIKVYDSAELDEQTAISPKTLDIALKTDKKSGLFGNMGVGYGSRSRAEAIGSINYYNKSLQASAFAAGNNTNREAYTFNEFQRINTFRAGNTTNDSYASSLNMPGLNHFKILGGRIQNEWKANSRSSVDGLRYIKRRLLATNSDQVISTNDGEQHIRTARNENSDNRVTKFTNENTYTHESEKYAQAFTLNINLDRTEQRGSENYYREAALDGNDISSLSTDNVIDAKNHTDNLSLEYVNRDKVYTLERLKFSYNYQNITSNHTLDQFLSFEDVEDDLEIMDRKKLNSLALNYHETKFSIDPASLFGKFPAWRPILSNSLSYGKQDEVQDDFFFDSLANSYSIANTPLLYQDRYSSVNWIPGIAFTRSFYQKLGRGNDRVIVTPELNYQYVWKTNRSNNENRQWVFQNRSFLPALELAYRRVRFQMYERNFILKYSTEVINPELFQATSLFDATQKEFNFVGNKNLEAEIQYKWDFRITDNKTGQNQQQTLALNYTLRKNQIIDSTVFDNKGGRITIPVNYKGLPYYAIEYQYRSTTDVFNRPFSVFGLGNVKGGNHYYYLDADLKRVRNVDLNLNVNMNYTISDRFDVALSNSIGIVTNHFDDVSWQHRRFGIRGDILYQLTPRTRLTNSFNYGGYHMSHVSPLTEYIWNIHFTHRMLQKEQLELKVSAFDILKNKINVVRNINNNMIENQIRNNLQQYFIISLSYFIRQF